jgi:hypothetical protein
LTNTKTGKKKRETVGVARISKTSIDGEKSMGDGEKSMGWHRGRVLERIHRLPGTNRPGV